MTTKSVLSLGAALCLCLGLFGCKLFKKGQSAPNVPHAPTPPPTELASTPPPAERPYMSPPLIIGYKEGDPILPTPVNPTPAVRKVEPPYLVWNITKHGGFMNKLHGSFLLSLANAEPMPLPPAPHLDVIPVLEQKPGVIDQLTLPNSVTENSDNGLFYRAGEQEPYTGSAVFTYANGQRKFEGFFKNGRRDGPCLEWYENGRKHYEGIFRNGKMHRGNEYWYYADSLTLKLLGVYEGGRMVRGQHWNRQGGIFR